MAGFSMETQFDPPIRIAILTHQTADAEHLSFPCIGGLSSTLRLLPRRAMRPDGYALLLVDLPGRYAEC